jgi:hypothetical protein
MNGFTKDQLAVVRAFLAQALGLGDSFIGVTQWLNHQLSGPTL